MSSLGLRRAMNFFAARSWIACSFSSTFIHAGSSGMSGMSGSFGTGRVRWWTRARRAPCGSVLPGHHRPGQLLPLHHPERRREDHDARVGGQRPLGIGPYVIGEAVGGVGELEQPGPVDPLGQPDGGRVVDHEALGAGGVGRVQVPAVLVGVGGPGRLKPRVTDPGELVGPARPGSGPRPPSPR